MESFGRYLSRQRELRGMSRGEVARLTRLAPPVIDALEEERYEALPGRVFVVGYLRLYANAIGMDADEAVLRFEEWGQANPEAAPPEPAMTRRPARRPLPRAAIAAVAVAAVAALLWWMA